MGIWQRITRWWRQDQGAVITTADPPVGQITTAASGDGAVAVGSAYNSQFFINTEGLIPVSKEKSAARKTCTLKADLPDFTGRRDQVEWLHRILEKPGGRAALDGLGGVGKTSLAVHVAHLVKDAYPDGQIQVDLKGVSDSPLTPAVAMQEVIRAFQPEAPPAEEAQAVAAIYRRLLDGKKVLLLWDNAKDGAQVRPLLDETPGSCGLVVTSRKTMVLPGVQSRNLEVLPEEEARDLLGTILGLRRAGDPELGLLAGCCGCLPLALRVAGSFLAAKRDWTVREYLEELAEERGRLERLRHEDLDVGAVLGLSAAQLVREQPELAARWQELTIFPGSFDREAAAAVLGVQEKEARDWLSTLLERALLLFDQPAGRYRFHDLMRPVAATVFDYGPVTTHSAVAEACLETSRRRLAGYFLEALRQADELYLQGGDGVLAGLALFDREAENVRTGQAWAAAHTDQDDQAAAWSNAYPIAGVYVLNLRLHPRERIKWLEAGLAGARHINYRAAEGAHLGNLGIAYANLGEPRRAIEYHEQALTVSREIGEKRAEGQDLGNLGLAYASLGEPRRAIEYYDKVLGIMREFRDRRGEGSALGNLGLAYADLGEPRRAIEYYEQRIVIARKIGDRRGEGQALGNLGNAYADLSEPRRAIEYYEQHLAIARKIGDRRGEGNALGSLGIAYAALGETRRAMENYKQWLVIAREIGHRRGEGQACFNMSLACDQLGDREQAVALAEQALQIFKQIEDPNAEKVRRQLAVWRGNEQGV